MIKFLVVSQTSICTVFFLLHVEIGGGTTFWVENGKHSLFFVSEDSLIKKRNLKDQYHYFDEPTVRYLPVGLLY